MSLVNPAALLLAGLALPIIVFYILKIRLRRFPVSTLLFWQQIFEEKKPQVPFSEAAASAFAAVAARLSGFPGLRSGGPDFSVAAGTGAAAGAGGGQLLEHECQRRHPEPARGSQGRRPAVDRGHAAGRRVGDHRGRGPDARHLRADRPRADPARRARFDHRERRTDSRRRRRCTRAGASCRAPRKYAGLSFSPTAASRARPNWPAKRTSR